jgi:hypothetical protein
VLFAVLCVLCGPAGLKAALAGTCFCSDDDSLVLEDEGARMVLRSECEGLKLDSVVTGGCVAQQLGLLRRGVCVA